MKAGDTMATGNALTCSLLKKTIMMVKTIIRKNMIDGTMTNFLRLITVKVSITKEIKLMILNVITREIGMIGKMTKMVTINGNLSI